MNNNDLKWEEDILAFEQSDRTNPPPKGAVLFVGSSTIGLWRSLEQDFPSVSVMNRGFGGSEIEDVIRYVDRIVIPYRPRLIVFYAGDNDLASGKTPEKVLAHYRDFVSRTHARLPKVRIAFISIKPSPSRRHLIASIQKANTLVKDYCAQDDRLAYIDVFSQMIEPDGTPRKELFVEDDLHMNAKGYALWTTVVGPFLK